MDYEEECPICYEKYGEQEDGNFLCKDGKCNSGCENECNHYICVKCCKTLRDKFIEDDEEEEDEEKKVRCPLCREDWTDWIESNYCSDDETDEDESEDEDNHDYENSCDCCVKGWDIPNEFGLCSCWCSNCKKPLAKCRYTCKK